MTSDLLKELSFDLHDIDVSTISIPLGSTLRDIASTVALKSIYDPQWGLLAGRCLMRSLSIPSKFSFSAKLAKHILNRDYYNFVMANAIILDRMVVPIRDYNFDYFAMETLIKSYLGRINGEINESPQYMYMRVAVYLRYPNLTEIAQVYEDLSLGRISQASPCYFNAGTLRPQMSSCFLMTVQDSTSELAKSWAEQAFISKNSGGLGICFSNIRHSEIGGATGKSKGIVPWIKITEQILKTVDQGGKRAGVGAVYLRDCHVDIFEFVELRDVGPEDIRARDIFLGLMMSDLFMKRLEAALLSSDPSSTKISSEASPSVESAPNGASPSVESAPSVEWSLFCPNKSDDLFQLYGTAFENKYLSLERQGRAVRTVPIKTLWQHICQQQIKRGTPYMLYIDSINYKCNQKNSGFVSCSNLCSEITEIVSEDEIASCVLGSICLNKCVVFTPSPKFDFGELARLTKQMVRNLNAVIDKNYYMPEVPKIKFSNLKHRPLGIGVQGQADVFAMMNIAWVGSDRKLSPPAKFLNRCIYEVMYYSALQESIQLAKEFGPYETFSSSPAAQGILQFDLWDDPKSPRGSPRNTHVYYTDFEWDVLKEDIMKHGLRNSLLLSLMPTASTAQILGNTEAFEPPAELITTRTVLSGYFIVVNKHMVKDLKSIGLWTPETIDAIIREKGSLKSIYSEENSEKLLFFKQKYLTVYELPQRALLELAADRARYICQSQSLNIFMSNPTMKSLTACHFTSWKLGLKTGMYYLRQSQRVEPINISLKPAVQKKKSTAVVTCTDDVCTSCSG
jgi:ribonucleoside-diphosphate reductase alpha subunit